MRTRSLLILLAITLVAAATTAVVLSRYERGTRLALSEQPMFPDLFAQAGTIDRVVLKTGSATTRLVKDASGWHVGERHDFKADTDKLADLIAEVGRIRLIEPRSENPELFDRMDLAGPDLAGSLGKQVTLAAGDKILADLIVGKTRRTAGTGPRQFFTRHAAGTQTWLAEGVIDPSPQPTAWLYKTAIDIQQSRIRRLEIRHPDGDRSLMERDTPSDSFRLMNAPKGRAVKQAAVTSATYGIQGLPLNDVFTAEEKTIEFESPVVAEFTTFDGLILTTEVQARMDSYYLRVKASPAAGIAPPPAATGPESSAVPDPAAEAARLNAELSNWVFLIPPHTADTFGRRLDGLLEEPPADAAAGTPKP